jgi:hypothetical protein
MALVFADRVQQTGTANTTVSFTLSGTVAGYQAFTAIGNNNTVYYGATDASGNWEAGLGTYSTTGPTLTRTTVYSSSNSGSAVTFSGTVNIFSTYPASRNISLDASGNATALGTVASGTWQGTTVATAYGGTGVTSSSGASSVVLRDANQNVSFNNYTANAVAVTAAAGTTVLTVGSARTQILVGSTTQTFQLPDATTLALGQSFLFVNNSSGVLTVKDNASTTIETVPSGGVTQMGAVSIATSAGSWGSYSFIPAAVDWGTNALNLATTVISGGTWQGGTITSGYGGTGLTTFGGANSALYSTSASALAAGTLPVAAGGTGATATPTNGQLLIGNGTNYTVATLGSGTGISTTTGSGTLTVNNTGVTSNVAGTGVTVSGATGAVTISIGQAVATSSNVQFNSLGVGTAGSATAGEIRATNNVTAYYASDIKFKENIQPIVGAGEIIREIGGNYFDWTDEYIAEHGGEDGYFVQKADFGVIAQKVQKVFPKAVRTREDGTLAVDYEKLGILAFPAIADMLDRLDAIEAKLKG